MTINQLEKQLQKAKQNLKKEKDKCKLRIKKEKDKCNKRIKNEKDKCKKKLDKLKNKKPSQNNKLTLLQYKKIEIEMNAIEDYDDELVDSIKYYYDTVNNDAKNPNKKKALKFVNRYETTVSKFHTAYIHFRDMLPNQLLIPTYSYTKIKTMLNNVKKLARLGNEIQVKLEGTLRKELKKLKIKGI